MADAFAGIATQRLRACIFDTVVAGRYGFRLGGRFERCGERLCGCCMETRSGVFNAQDPAFRIIGSAVTPGNADAPSMGVLDCIEDQVLSNASDLDGIPVGREAFGTCTLQ